MFQLISQDALTGFVVLNNALSGLVIAAIIKYTDNIVRVYAHSMGMLLTMIVSSVIFQQIPSTQLLFGASIVSISIFLFYTDLTVESTTYYGQYQHFKSGEEEEGRGLSSGNEEEDQELLKLKLPNERERNREEYHNS